MEKSRIHAKPSTPAFFMLRFSDFAIFRFCDFAIFLIIVRFTKKRKNIFTFVKWFTLKKNQKIARFIFKKKMQMWMVPYSKLISIHFEVVCANLSVSRFCWRLLRSIPP